MNISILLTRFACGVVGAVTIASGPYAKEADGPTLFAPEAYWPAGSDASPAFTHDGRAVFFTHSDGAKRTIMLSHLRNGVWSAPEIAPFSGTWRDIEPAMAPDGSYLIFISNRPATGHGEPLTGFFGGVSQPGLGGNIWRVDRKGDGWGAPVRLPEIVNANSAIYSPAVSGDGSVYFNQPDPVTRKNHIYRAQRTKNGFLTPAPLPISDGTIGDYDVAVAPDESFIIFSSAGRAPAPPGHSLMFISFARSGQWTTPVAIQPTIEGLEARFSPDLKTLYFSAQLRDSAGGSSASGNAPSRIFQTSLGGALTTLQH